MITNFKTNIKDKNGLKTLEIKYREITLINWGEANQFVSKFIRQGWIVSKDYRDNYTDESIIVLTKV
jgi:hypothetical protein|tara:strand:+ start:770 stop:970 length:201 start_codon:yes stop_codon:yes gene_type:complete